ncbi:hypothetical protein [Humibacter ginsenosidimutans]|uniref:Uncharacterized protein n=1 Tax=Humibacter ginsenosidimutans TaxID=2599293 RepID=A0A5B8M6J1_9MICO|nr:hypothetical protein [Humibacter ginsenosidimutans]QDZ15811.1 hypothetical protein FPZ11_14480 [Humibacter ginsenosidimutans]
MNPLLAYLLFLLAATSVLLLALQSWAAAIPIVLFAWLFGEWLAFLIARAVRHRRRHIRVTDLPERTTEK